MTELFGAIDHVAIAVENLDEAIAMYEGVFGMKMTHRETNPEQMVEEAMMQVGESFIQLITPTSDESPVRKQLDKRGPGIVHMGYRVHSMEETTKACEAAGLKLLYPEPKNGTAGSKINFIHPKTAGGVLVELVQPGEGHH